MPINLWCDCSCKVDWLLVARNFLFIGTPMFLTVSWVALKLLGPYLKGEDSEYKHKAKILSIDRQERRRLL